MKNLNTQLQAQLERMAATGKLFRANITGDSLWNIYLQAFQPEHDPVFRDPQSSTHNCNHCNNFVRRYGNIVAVDGTTIMTLFDFQAEPEYRASVDALAIAVRSAGIQNVFFETFDELNKLPYERCHKNNTVFRLGIDKNVKMYTREEAEKYGVVKPEEVRTFHHMHLDLPKTFVDTSGKSAEAIMGEYRDAKNVFQRAMQEIPLDTLLLVRDLINQGSLLDGATHLHKVERMIPLKQQYDAIPDQDKDVWCWIQSYRLPYAKFKNELVGVLCSELAEGEELNKACQSWNKRVDPINYMKASAPITQRQIEEAKRFVEDNGYAESFNRRCAVLDDIKASEIKHLNAGSGKIKAVSIFDGVKSASTRHKRSEFEGVEEVGIEKFMADILPNCTSVEALLKNIHQGHMVTLTTSASEGSKPAFKWSNNYSWTYNGNLAGKSQIKQAVKAEGGKIDGVLRFSIIWNEDGKEILDFDAHALQPDRNEICFSTFKGKKTAMSGMLDVDMINPQKMGVENIVWDNKSQMRDGVYRFWIRNFNGGSNKGFKAEIEFDGEIYSYEYLTPVSYKKDVHVAEVTLKGGEFSIKHLIPESGVSSKEIYGLATNEFHKVNLVCLSPNHWNGEQVGNKHYFFMLEGCRTQNPIRGFHNENLNAELLKHRKVMEVLGATHMITPDQEQLSGLGFNATVPDELIVKVSGSHKRMLKIKF